MPRSTIIFGNGLGMAINPVGFSLSTALAAEWSSDGCLSEDEKKLINQCIEHRPEGEPPNGEEDMLVLHRVMAACDFLSRVGEEDLHWLNPQGEQFPEAIRAYVTSVAWYFHKLGERLEDDDFIDSLCEYLADTKSHIATLNYDNLLYQKLIERNILDGYRGCLVDGILSEASGGFRAKNMIRKQGNNFGYYMHLHGSPLFYDQTGTNFILKQRQGESDYIPTKHIVLTHIEHKRSVIAESPILKAYWDYFRKALQESDRITLFGYSGLDRHLNELIRLELADGGTDFCVVEWKGAGELDERHDFWSKELGGGVDLVHLENILEFREWAGSEEF